MKRYIKPEVAMVLVQTTQMLASSDPKLNGTYEVGGQVLSRENNSSSLWDDDDDEY